MIRLRFASARHVRALAIATFVALLLSASAAEARYVRVWGWSWQPDPPRYLERHPMTRGEIRAVYPGLYRPTWRWDLGEQERESLRWVRHCRIMSAALGWRPFGCR